MVVFKRLPAGFAYCFKSCEVDNCVDLLVCEDPAGAFIVQHIRFIEFEVLACDLPYPVECLRLGVAEVIHYNNVIARIEKFNTSMASDKACAACYKNCTHNNSPPFTF